MTRYTSWDRRAVDALWQHGFAYDIDKDSSFKVTSLNRIKKFLERVVWIQKPTRNLILGILETTKSWEYIWKWIDTGMNMCDLFLVHIWRFKENVTELLNSGSLRKQAQDDYITP